MNEEEFDEAFKVHWVEDFVSWAEEHLTDDEWMQWFESGDVENVSAEIWEKRLRFLDGA